MDLVSKPQSSAPVWEHFGFKPNERGEPINVNEPVCRLCLKTVATKRGNTTNLKSHLKHNHPTQFLNLGTTTAAGAGEGSSRQLSVTDAFSRQCKCNGCMPVRTVCKPHSSDLKMRRSSD